MQVRVEKILSPRPAPTVQFSCEYGLATARWCGTEPRVGETLDVEFAAEGELSWGQTVISSENFRPEIVGRGNNKVSLSGLLSESEHEDGCLFLTLGTALIILEVEGVPSGFSGPVQVSVESLKLYPTNI